MDKTLLVNNDRVKTWEIFLLLAVVNLLQIYLTDQYFFTHRIFYHLYQGRMTTNQIQSYLYGLKDFSLIKYLTAPLLLFIRISFVTLLLQFFLIAFFFVEINTKRVFRLVTIATFLLIIANLLQAAWYLYLPVQDITEKILLVIPGSLASFFNMDNLSRASIFCLSQINFFELFWVIIISIGLYMTGKIKSINAYTATSCTWILIFISQWVSLTFLEKLTN